MVTKKATTRRPAPKTYPDPPPIPPETAERLERLLTAAEWTFAAQDAARGNPHSYSKREAWPSQRDFEWAVEMINRHGRWERFNSSRWRVLHLPHIGFYFWTGWMRPEFTRWINKKPIAWKP